MHGRKPNVAVVLVLLVGLAALSSHRAPAQEGIAQTDADFQALVPFYKKLMELGCNAVIDRTVLNIDLSEKHITKDGLFRPDVFAVMKQVPAIGRIDIRDGDNAISDAGLAQLKELKPLRGLDLFYASEVTDEGVKHLANMTELRYLGLQETQVTDRGLKYLEKLTNLEVLNLEACDNIRGAGLAHVAALPKLRKLDLAYGALTDEVGEVRGFAHLKEIFLKRQRNLTSKGLAFLQHMVELENLDMYETCNGDFGEEVGSVDDQVLSYLQLLVKLKRLTIDHPVATDRGLRHLAGMTQMEYLTISHPSNITGAGLVHLERMSNLRGLYIFGSKNFNGEGLAVLKKMPNLEVLSLGSCPALTDKAFEGLGDLRINRLVLSETGITDKALDALADLPQLTSLELPKTAVTDAGLARIARCSTLEHLQLSETKITDAGLAKLITLRKLESLWIGKTAVTQKGIDSLKSKIDGLRIYER